MEEEAPLATAEEVVSSDASAEVRVAVEAFLIRGVLVAGLATTRAAASSALKKGATAPSPAESERVEVVRVVSAADSAGAERVSAGDSAAEVAPLEVEEVVPTLATAPVVEFSSICRMTAPAESDD